MGTVTSYLLDTHVFLLAIQEDGKLSRRAHDVIENPASHLYLSAISAFEVANKYRIGKLPEYAYIVENYASIARTFGAIELPVNAEHACFAAKFDWTHRDPFDRMLAAQASIEHLTLITTDAVFSTLDWLETLW